MVQQSPPAAVVVNSPPAAIVQQSPPAAVVINSPPAAIVISSPPAAVAAQPPALALQSPPPAAIIPFSPPGAAAGCPLVGASTCDLNSPPFPADCDLCVGSSDCCADVSSAAFGYCQTSGACEWLMIAPRAVHQPRTCRRAMPALPCYV